MSKGFHGGESIHFDDESKEGFDYLKKKHSSNSETLQGYIERAKGGEKVDFEADGHRYRLRKDSDKVLRIEKLDHY